MTRISRHRRDARDALGFALLSCGPDPAGRCASFRAAARSGLRQLRRARELYRSNADQMRHAVQLDRSRPPEQTTATIEGCPTKDGETCAWPTFDALASKAIDHACLGAQ